MYKIFSLRLIKKNNYIKLITSLRDNFTKVSLLFFLISINTLLSILRQQ